jgi:hypothetical protein
MKMASLIDPTNRNNTVLLMPKWCSSQQPSASSLSLFHAGGAGLFAEQDPWALVVGPQTEALMPKWCLPQQPSTVFVYFFLFDAGGAGLFAEEDPGPELLTGNVAWGDKALELAQVGGLTRVDLLICFFPVCRF